MVSFHSPSIAPSVNAPIALITASPKKPHLLLSNGYSCFLTAPQLELRNKILFAQYEMPFHGIQEESLFPDIEPKPITFTLPELFRYIVLHVPNAKNSDLFLSGGAACNILSGLEFADIDLSIYLPSDLVNIKDLMLGFFHDKLIKLNPKFENAFTPLYIDRGYLTDFIDVTGNFVLFGFGLKVQLKFVNDQAAHRHCVAITDGFHITMCSKEHAAAWFNDKEVTEEQLKKEGAVYCVDRDQPGNVQHYQKALDALIKRQLIIYDPEAAKELILRIAHRCSQGFSIPRALIAVALKNLEKEYPLNKSKLLRNRFQKHQKNHYSDNIGQILDLLNVLHLLRTMESAKQHAYIRVFCDNNNTSISIFSLSVHEKPELLNTLLDYVHGVHFMAWMHGAPGFSGYPVFGQSLNELTHIEPHLCLSRTVDGITRYIHTDKNPSELIVAFLQACYEFKKIYINPAHSKSLLAQFGIFIDYPLENLEKTSQFLLDAVLKSPLTLILRNFKISPVHVFENIRRSNFDCIQEKDLDTRIQKHHLQCALIHAQSTRQKATTDLIKTLIENVTNQDNLDKLGKLLKELDAKVVTLPIHISQILYEQMLELFSDPQRIEANTQVLLHTHRLFDGEQKGTFTYILMHHYRFQTDWKKPEHASAALSFIKKVIEWKDLSSILQDMLILFNGEIQQHLHEAITEYSEGSPIKAIQPLSILIESYHWRENTPSFESLCFTIIEALPISKQALQDITKIVLAHIATERITLKIGTLLLKKLCDSVEKTNESQELILTFLDKFVPYYTNSTDLQTSLLICCEKFLSAQHIDSSIKTEYINLFTEHLIALKTTSHEWGSHFNTFRRLPNHKSFLFITTQINQELATTWFYKHARIPTNLNAEDAAFIRHVLIVRISKSDTVEDSLKTAFQLWRDAKELRSLYTPKSELECLFTGMQLLLVALKHKTEEDIAGLSEDIYQLLNKERAYDSKSKEKLVKSLKEIIKLLNPIHPREALDLETLGINNEWLPKKAVIDSSPIAPAFIEKDVVKDPLDAFLLKRNPSAAELKKIARLPEPTKRLLNLYIAKDKRVKESQLEFLYPLIANDKRYTDLLCACALRIFESNLISKSTYEQFLLPFLERCLELQTSNTHAFILKMIQCSHLPKKYTNNLLEKLILFLDTTFYATSAPDEKLSSYMGYLLKHHNAFWVKNPVFEKNSYLKSEALLNAHMIEELKKHLNTLKKTSIETYQEHKSAILDYLYAKYLFTSKGEGLKKFGDKEPAAILKQIADYVEFCSSFLTEHLKSESENNLWNQINDAFVDLCYRCCTKEFPGNDVLLLVTMLRNLKGQINTFLFVPKRKLDIEELKTIGASEEKTKELLSEYIKTQNIEPTSIIELYKTIKHNTTELFYESAHLLFETTPKEVYEPYYISLIRKARLKNSAENDFFKHIALRPSISRAIHEEMIAYSLTYDLDYLVYLFGLALSCESSGIHPFVSTVIDLKNLPAQGCEKIIDNLIVSKKIPELSFAVTNKYIIQQLSSDLKSRICAFACLSNDPLLIGRTRYVINLTDYGKWLETASVTPNISKAVLKIVTDDLEEGFLTNPQLDNDTKLQIMPALLRYIIQADSNIQMDQRQKLFLLMGKKNGAFKFARFGLGNDEERTLRIFTQFLLILTSFYTTQKKTTIESNENNLLVLTPEDFDLAKVSENSSDEYIKFYIHFFYYQCLVSPQSYELRTSLQDNLPEFLNFLAQNPFNTITKIISGGPEILSAVTSLCIYQIHHGVNKETASRLFKYILDFCGTKSLGRVNRQSDTLMLTAKFLSEDQYFQNKEEQISLWRIILGILEISQVNSLCSLIASDLIDKRAFNRLIVFLNVINQLITDASKIKNQIAIALTMHVYNAADITQNNMNSIVRLYRALLPMDFNIDHSIHIFQNLYSALKLQCQKMQQRKSASLKEIAQIDFEIEDIHKEITKSQKDKFVQVALQRLMDFLPIVQKQKTQEEHWNELRELNDRLNPRYIDPYKSFNDFAAKINFTSISACEQNITKCFEFCEDLLAVVHNPKNINSVDNVIIIKNALSPAYIDLLCRVMITTLKANLKISEKHVKLLRVIFEVLSVNQTKAQPELMIRFGNVYIEYLKKHYSPELLLTFVNNPIIAQTACNKLLHLLIEKKIISEIIIALHNTAVLCLLDDTISDALLELASKSNNVVLHQNAHLVFVHGKRQSRTDSYLKWVELVKTNPELNKHLGHLILQDIESGFLANTQMPVKSKSDLIYLLFAYVVESFRSTTTLTIMEGYIEALIQQNEVMNVIKNDNKLFYAIMKLLIKTGMPALFNVAIQCLKHEGTNSPTREAIISATANILDSYRLENLPLKLHKMENTQPYLMVPGMAIYDKYFDLTLADYIPENIQIREFKTGLLSIPIIKFYVRYYAVRCRLYVTGLKPNIFDTAPKELPVILDYIHAHYEDIKKVINLEEIALIASTMLYKSFSVNHQQAFEIIKKCLLDVDQTSMVYSYNAELLCVYSYDLYTNVFNLDPWKILFSDKSSSNNSSYFLLAAFTSIWLLERIQFESLDEFMDLLEERFSAKAYCRFQDAMYRYFLDNISAIMMVYCEVNDLLFKCFHLFSRLIPKKISDTQHNADLYFTILSTLLSSYVPGEIYGQMTEANKAPYHAILRKIDKRLVELDPNRMLQALQEAIEKCHKNYGLQHQQVKTTIQKIINRKF